MNTAQEWAGIIQDYISVLAWPVFGLACVIIFRKNIGELVDRIQKGKFPGGEFESPTQQPPPSPQELAGAAADDSSVQPTSQDAFGQDPATVQETVNRLAQLLFFEKVYRLAFGSQLAALRFLNAFHVIGAPREGLREFYELYRTRSAELNLAPMDEEVWMRFFLQTEMVTPTEQGFAITQRGRDFLVWIVQEGVPGDKPL